MSEAAGDAEDQLVGEVAVVKAGGFSDRLFAAGVACCAVGKVVGLVVMLSR